MEKGRARTMRDRALDVLLMIFFGIGGVIILVLTWSQPMIPAERILATTIGMIGLVWTGARVRFLRLAPVAVPVKTSHGQNTLEMHPGDDGN